MSRSNSIQTHKWGQWKFCFKLNFCEWAVTFLQFYNLAPVSQWAPFPQWNVSSTKTMQWYPEPVRPCLKYSKSFSLIIFPVIFQMLPTPQFKSSKFHLWDSSPLTAALIQGVPRRTKPKTNTAKSHDKQIKRPPPSFSSAASISSDSRSVRVFTRATKRPSLRPLHKQQHYMPGCEAGMEVLT